VGGGGTFKLAPKKILVKQLEEWKENEVMMQKKKMQKKWKMTRVGRVTLAWMKW
jgi:hypothetical protein